MKDETKKQCPECWNIEDEQYTCGTCWNQGGGGYLDESTPASKQGEALKSPYASNRDWTEDFEHENGQYLNRCNECRLMFQGHKRRVTCKCCSVPPQGAVEAQGGERKDKFLSVLNNQYKNVQENIPDGFLRNNLIDVYENLISQYNECKSTFLKPEGIPTIEEIEDTLIGSMSPYSDAPVCGSFPAAKAIQELYAQQSQGGEWVSVNSETLIGRSKERFKELEAKGWDWRSFYNGWIEGRVDFWKASPKQGYTKDDLIKAYEYGQSDCGEFGEVMGFNEWFDNYTPPQKGE